jgi:hypothetical protein
MRIELKLGVVKNLPHEIGWLTFATIGFRRQGEESGGFLYSEPV